MSEALGLTPWYLRLLRDESQTAEHMAHLLATSPFATDLLLRAPDAVQMLADDEQLRPRPAADIAAEALTAGLRQADPESAIAAIRATRRRELFRISAADCLGLLSIDEVGQALSHIADATIQAALAVATQVVRPRKAGRGPGRVRHHRHGPIRRGGTRIRIGRGRDVRVPGP